MALLARKLTVTKGPDRVNGHIVNVTGWGALLAANLAVLRVQTQALYIDDYRLGWLAGRSGNLTSWEGLAAQKVDAHMTGLHEKVSSGG